MDNNNRIDINGGNDIFSSNNNINDIFHLDGYQHFDQLVQCNYQQSQQQQQLSPGQPTHNFRSLASEALTDFNFTNSKFLQLTTHSHR